MTAIIDPALVRKLVIELYECLDREAARKWSKCLNGPFERILIPSDERTDAALQNARRFLAQLPPGLRGKA